MTIFRSIINSTMNAVGDCKRRLFNSIEARRFIYPDSRPTSTQPPSNAFYVLVVNTTQGYRFVSCQGGYLCIEHAPSQYFSFPDDDLLVLWKRTAIDRQTYWDDYGVDSSSLRFVKMTISMEDATSELFETEDEAAHYKKLALLAAIGPEASILLGADDLYAQVALIASGHDEKLSQQICSSCAKKGKALRTIDFIGPNVFSDHS